MFNENLNGRINNRDKCVAFLKSLKSTVEWLLSSYTSNVWNTYGSLSRVCNIVDEILSHGLRDKNPEKYWHFLCGLRVFRPDRAPPILASELNGLKDQKEQRTLVQSWLRQNLLDHCLSSQLRSLIHDENHVAEYYEESAFLRNTAFVSGLFICLNAVEQNNSMLLEDFNPEKISFVLTDGNELTMVETLTRSTSLNFQDMKSTSSSTNCKTLSTSQHNVHLCTNTKSSPKRRTTRFHNVKKQVSERKTNSLFAVKTSEVLSNDLPIKPRLDRSRSHPEVHSKSPPLLQRCHSYPSADSNTESHSHSVKDKESNVAIVTSGNWKAQHSRSKSDGAGVLNSSLLSDELHQKVDNVLCSSMPSILLEQQQQKSILGGSAIVVPTECFFPRPQPGQTLMSFLSSDFNICAELDRENAHFCVSEALISAIEEIKCTESLRLAAEEAESDEEIKDLTQRIRIRRREKLQEKVLKNTAFLSDGRTDTTTTSQSASPMSTSHSSDFGAADSITSEDDTVHDLELSDRNASNLAAVKESGLSLSMASMYSEADLLKGSGILPVIDFVDRRSDDLVSNQLSAEAVALSLLKRFSEKQLPKASDMKWLVSEQDAQQSLLPLPDSWPVAPDAIDEENNLEKTRLRGNLQWAPPRPQLIFNIHPDPKQKDAILKQNCLCAGCGMKVERNYIKKFRYCDYLGKFFCHCCHSNNQFYIPARIFWKWDFKQYYVSRFSAKLLDQMLFDPLFNIMDINNKLYRKIRQLDLCREFRVQLYYLVNFVRTCRCCKQIEQEYDQLPQHVYVEPHLYSINDFLKVRSGEMCKQLSSLVTRSIAHVKQCVLCQAKGFICEMCNKFNDIIFPFQLTKVCLCSLCGACFHKNCFKVGSCPKCVRINERKRKLLEPKEIFSDEEL